MVGNDTESDILTAHDLDEVSLGKGEVVELDGDLVTVREVGLCTLSEVADDHPGAAGRARSGVGRKGILEVHGKALERVNSIAGCISSGLDLCPAALVQNNDRIDRLVREGSDGLGNKTDRRSTGNNTDTSGGSGSGSGAGRDLGDQLFLGLLGDAVGEFIVDVVEELGTRQIHCLVRDLDPFLDGGRSELNNTKGEGLIGRSGGAFGVHNSTVSGQLEADLQVALDVGLADKIHDTELLPCGADAAFDHRGHGNTAGNIGSKKSGTALFVIAGLQIVCKCVHILRAGADFFKSHFFSLLSFKFFSDFTIALCDSVADLVPLVFGGFAVLYLFIDRASFSLQCIEVSLGSIDFRGDRTPTLHQFLDSFVFEFHQSTSVSILIFCFLRSISFRRLRSLSSDSFALSSASERPRVCMEVCA